MKVAVAKTACIPEADAVRDLNFSMTVKTDFHVLLNIPFMEVSIESPFTRLELFLEIFLIGTYSKW
jgi:hypothetical protein